jgi:NADH-quinone oxidoreductase subunit C
MTREELIIDIKDNFPEQIIDFHDKSPARIFIEIDPVYLTEISTYVFRVLKARFNIATGIDTRSHFEILYHFSIEDLMLLISLRVKLDKQQPVVQSIAKLIPGANWIEREIHELLGIDFQDHPDMRKLLLSEDWPEGVYPLRRDYKEWDSQAIRDRGV